MASDPENIKNFLYICTAVIGLAGTFFGIGKYFGKKNHETEELKKMWQAIETNETKTKSRFYTPNGDQIFVRAENCEKTHSAMRADSSVMRADLHELQKTQQKYDLTLSNIDSNVRMLVGLFEAFTKRN